MKNIALFVLIIIIIILACFVYEENYDEHFSGTNEGIQNISSVYNTGKVSVNNVSAEEAITSKTLATNKITVNTIASSEESGNVTFSGGLTFGGSICAGDVCLPQQDFKKLIRYMSMKDMMYDGNAVIHQNIFTPLTNNIITQKGNPGSWNSTSNVTSLWNGLPILNIGNNNQSAISGLTVNVPTGMNVIWVRILNDRWACIQLFDSSNNPLNIYASGFRNLVNIDPNGCATDASWAFHKWVPIPVPSAGAYTLVGAGNGSDNWISGIAFSTNPWNHAMNSAVAYYWAINAGSACAWNTNNWNNDILAQINNGTTVTLAVPVVPSGNDKLVYIVEYNYNNVGTQHTSVTVGGQQIERFKTTYMNPFATHYNSKIYSKYIAARIPSSLIKSTDRVVNVVISLQNNDNPIYFREVGTHDYL